MTESLIQTILRHRGAVPVESQDVRMGSRLMFVTDSGDGSPGVGFWRTGTVWKITSAVIYVECEHNRLGRWAVLNRKDWTCRSVHELPWDDRCSVCGHPQHDQKQCQGCTCLASRTI